MTSLEIAELASKQHKNVMQAIRNMEPAWEKTCGLKFQLTSRTIIQPNGGTREVPCYQLTKTECLYIATKFNDEARARLVLRWEELENVTRGVTKDCNATLSQREPSPCYTLPAPKEILRLADDIIGAGLRLLNDPAEDTLTATRVAKAFNMTTQDFNCVVRDMGIQYRRNGRWNLSDDLQGRGYTAVRTYISYTLKGEKRIRHYMTWTLAGLRYLNSKLGYPNF